MHALDTVGYSVHKLHFLRGVILDDNFDVWPVFMGLPRSHDRQLSRLAGVKDVGNV